MSEHPSFIPRSLHAGVQFAGITIALTLCMYILELHGPLAITLVHLIVMWLLYFMAARAAIRPYRDIDLGGFISFGRAMLTGFVACLLMGTLFSIFEWSYINFIDDYSIRATFEQAIDILEKIGDEAQVELMEERMEEQIPFMKSMGGLGASIASRAATAAIFSLIAAAILQRTKVASS